MKDNAVSFFENSKKTLFKGSPGCWQLLFTGTTYHTNSGLMPGGNWWKLTGMVIGIPPTTTQ